MKRRPDIRIGISGWSYGPWRGKFYPKGLPHKGELGFVGQTFRSVEVNGTFYGSQRPETFAHWAEQVPEGFLFAIKGPRYITHTRRLKDVEKPLANFFATGLLGLGKKLGPILWQFPPNFSFDPDLMERFLRLLPRDMKAAARLARKHEKGFGRGPIKVSENRTIRHAVEIRHESFVTPDFVELLRAHGVALVCADTVEWPRLMDVTADFIYCRLHGSKKLYASGYSSRALDEWARRIDDWAHGVEPRGGDRASRKSPCKRATRDVFVYFDNDMKVKAPRDAKTLIGKLERRAKRK